MTLCYLYLLVLLCCLPACVKFESQHLHVTAGGSSDDVRYGHPGHLKQVCNAPASIDNSRRCSPFVRVHTSATDTTVSCWIALDVLAAQVAVCQPAFEPHRRVSLDVTSTRSHHPLNRSLKDEALHRYYWLVAVGNDNKHADCRFTPS